jgi:hypothetical protein
MCLMSRSRPKNNPTGAVAPRKTPNQKLDTIPGQFLA